MSTKTNTTETAARTCACGTCGEVITTNALYRPGHDARHVSALLGGIINSYADGHPVTKALINAEAKSLPSEALRAKFLRAADRLVAKQAQADAKAKEATA